VSAVIGIDARAALGQPTGVGRYVRNLVRHLLRIDPEDRFLLFADRPGGERLGGAAPNVAARVLRLPFAANAFTWLQLRLPPSLWRRPVDLFHYPFYTLPLWHPGPSVVTIHDVTFERHPEWFSRRSHLATRRFARFAARHAQAILTVSETSRCDLVDCYGVDPARIAVVYPAVEEGWDEAPAPSGEEVARRLGLEGPFLLHVGSIHTRRNVPLLLRAAARMRRRGDRIGVVLAGRVEYPYPDVSAMIRDSGMGGAAVHVGYVPEADLRALYRAARVVALPSLYEGFGLPGIEAMACGTPVVAARASCFPEVLGDAALLVDPHDEGGWAEALARAAAAGPERDEMVSRGRAHAARYSWDRAARETLGVYRRVLGVGRG
jgi:glycosyltransferase involved in cell wall biosynthesis